ncbi:MAG: tetratricopeptide repeat protein [Thermoanaerobaculaceae bacterium]|nr:tetratricopeptide repeat protein [Thermoanaerobaculaceae bacterium]MDI9623170.1 tetratricopeptide repeat protein [Acidobacteriota bacterium]NLH09957.1 tetratricopeptide repeat protein [Holophagae bacterium]HPW54516.1 tetratricopeptide repeat protein [Thermoanaerobaculaceae bacterium]
MKQWCGFAVLIALAVGSQAGVFERHLSADRPADRAIMAYLELEKRGKATSTDLAELAVLLVNKGFPNDAEDYLRAALKLDKHNHEAMFRLGLVLQCQGRNAAACRLYRRTLRERRGHGPARFMLALAEERAGRTRAAIRDYMRAYRHAPDLADPAKNPLVLDSRLQTQALLAHYRDTVDRATYHVYPIDARTVGQMMLIRPAPLAAAVSDSPLASDGGSAASVVTPPPPGPTAPPKPAAGTTPAATAKPSPPSGAAVEAPSPTITRQPARGIHIAPPTVLPTSNVSGAP